MKPKRKTTKKIVSLQSVVMGWATKLMKQKGYGNNFSEYVADLIRRNKRKLEAKKSKSFFPEHDGHSKDGTAV